MQTHFVDGEVVPPVIVTGAQSAGGAFRPSTCSPINWYCYIERTWTLPYRTDQLRLLKRSCTDSISLNSSDQTSGLSFSRSR
jgi:hypothetical protein